MDDIDLDLKSFITDFLEELDIDFLHYYRKLKSLNLHPFLF